MELVCIPRWNTHDNHDMPDVLLSSVVMDSESADFPLSESESADFFAAVSDGFGSSVSESIFTCQVAAFK